MCIRPVVLLQPEQPPCLPHCEQEGFLDQILVACLIDTIMLSDIHHNTTTCIGHHYFYLLYDLISWWFHHQDTTVRVKGEMLWPVCSNMTKKSTKFPLPSILGKDTAILSLSSITIIALSEYQELHKTGFKADLQMIKIWHEDWQVDETLQWSSTTEGLVHSLWWETVFKSN